MQRHRGVLKIALSGLVGLWAVTLVGVTFLAVRFYMREWNGGRRVPVDRPEDAARAARPASVPAFRVESEAREVDAEGATGPPSRRFVVLPRPRPKSRRRSRARRRRPGRRRLLVR